MVDGTPRRCDFAVIGAVGLAQLIAWGSLYYAIAIMADAIRRELGVSSPQVFAAFAASVALSGVLAPWAGRLVDRRGGRLVLFVGPLV
ncbi:MAG TPA: hypothetical protein VJR89_41240, partial [Polyangiales bacterium]|nr:hypothetical protein [Polyangiales bacterium]